MTKEQESHLSRIQERFHIDVGIKYRAGQKEHGGNLWDRSIQVDIIQEAIDLVTYAYTNAYKINQAISIIQQVRDCSSNLESQQINLLNEALEFLK